MIAKAASSARQYAKQMPIGDLSRRAARTAAVLFVIATATTMTAQMALETVPVGTSDLTSNQRDLIALAVWLFMRGLDLTRATTGGANAA